MQYRPYKSEDFEALYALEELCFQPPFRFERRYMRSAVGGKNAATWIAAEEDGAMAGFAIVHWDNQRGGARAYLETLEVRPEARGKGVGSELLRRCEESAKVAGAKVLDLHVDTENGSAIRVYEAKGFERTGRIENYYPEGRVADAYEKRLTEL